MLMIVMRLPFYLPCVLAVMLVLCSSRAGAGSLQVPIALNPDENIVLLGNALAERMQYDGWLETYLQAGFPEHRLVIRNHGFSGDQVAHRPRSQGFIDPHTYLTISEADTILAFFGYNESFDEDPEQYEQQLRRWIDDTRRQKYNGESAPRIVLFSPIAHEDLQNPNLPDSLAANQRLAAYAAATERAAKATDTVYLDLYRASFDLYQRANEPLTLNGIHLTGTGNRHLADRIFRDLFGKAPSADEKHLQQVRRAVLNKNWHWFHRYRATDGNDIWGGRGKLSFVDNQTNREVLSHELKMIDVMTANRDRQIWAFAQGDYAYEVDDANVPPPIVVESNIGGKSRSSSAAKEGHTDYMSPEATAAQLQPAAGMRVNVFASEQMFPELANPVQMGVDTRGRLWVAAWKTYPKWEPLKTMDDRLLILPDHDRDGVADKAITFAKVHNPTGFEFWNGGVIVVSAPNLLFLKDTDGDDRADVRFPILHGLDSADTHHTANNLVFGPCGNIYYQRGVFHVSHVETPWAKAQQHDNSGMYRFNPRTFEFAFHASNSPNPHGISFNYWGYHFATDGTGGRAYQVRPDSQGRFKMQKLLEKTVRPVPSSGVLNSGHFPEEHNETFLILNSIGYLGVKQYRIDVDENGDAWGEPMPDFLVSPTDRNFRPTDMAIGDDGALYIADWQNVIIGHMQHNIRDPNRDKTHGRIHRITCEGRPLMDHVDVDGQPIPRLLDHLTHPVNMVRYRTRVELSERDTPSVMTALKTWVAQWDPQDPAHAHHLLEALWLHQQHNLRNEALLETVLNSPVRDARIAARTVEHFWSLAPGQGAEIAPQVDEEPGPERTPSATLRERGLSEHDIAAYELGATIYARDSHCITCHQPDGNGIPNLYPPLTRSSWVQGDEERLVKITLKGLWGTLEHDGVIYNGETNTTPPMTGFASLLTDEEISALLTYVRNTFGNAAEPIPPDTVARIRAATAGQTTFYMVDELLKEHPFPQDEVPPPASVHVPEQ